MPRGKKSKFTLIDWVRIASVAVAANESERFNVFKTKALERAKELEDNEPEKWSDETWKNKITSVRSTLQDKIRVVDNKRVYVFRKQDDENLYSDKECTTLIPEGAKPYVLPVIAKPRKKSTNVNELLVHWIQFQWKNFPHSVRRT